MKSIKTCLRASSVVLLVGCSASPSSEELVGTATLAVTNAPSDGTCIQVTAAGFRTVTKSFDVPAGMSTILPMHGLPLGSVTFDAQAFAGACAMVNPMVTANWVSDPVTASVVVSPPVSVPLAMHRNGSASVSVDFPNEPGADAGAPSTCMPPQVACGMPQACVSLSVDPQNCGACGNVCPTAPNAVPICMGMCGISCNAGFANCNGAVADGCEVKVASDVNNCGGCGVQCAATNGTPACINGRCSIASCAAGFADCDMNPANGCETNVTNNPANCGGCGIQCAVPNATASCSMSTCVIASCAPGFADCDRVEVNGCETNLTSSPTNCGACGNACAAGQVCTMGVCH